MTAARVICQQIFSIFVLAIFLSKFLLEKCFLFCLTLASRSHCGDAISDVACSSMMFRNSVSADRIVVAASRLLGAAAACVIFFSFAAGSCK